MHGVITYTHTHAGSHIHTKDKFTTHPKGQFPRGTSPEPSLLFADVQEYPSAQDFGDAACALISSEVSERFKALFFVKTKRTATERLPNGFRA